MARKGLEGLLGTSRKVYKSFITAAFWPKLAINDNYTYIKFYPY